MNREEFNPASLYSNNSGPDIPVWRSTELAARGQAGTSSFPPAVWFTGRHKKSAGGRLMVIFPPPPSNAAQFMTFETLSQDFKFNT